LLASARGRPLAAPELGPARRLLVLIPAAEVDEPALARQLLLLALPRQLPILYFGLYPHESDEPRLRRRLASLAALTRAEGTGVDVRLTGGYDWIRAVAAVLRPGDVIVCHAEQSLGLWREPLDRALLRRLRAPVFTLSGFCPPVQTVAPGAGTRLMFWGIALALAAFFFWVQVQMDHLSNGWAHTLLLCLAVTAEFSVLWLWQRFLP
jgi:hypothetical protein